MSERYYLSMDNDGHWFVVPTDKAGEWGEWKRLDQDDERAWTPPDFAKQVGGSPSLVTFSNPEIS